VRTAARGRLCPKPTYLRPALRGRVSRSPRACASRAGAAVGSTLGAVPASDEPEGSSQPPPHASTGQASKDALERHGAVLSMP